ncbi:hypothetical protein [Flavobacterium sp.]|uniref:hypothetical protein n=1 Tax=Flavobacterium sp. TaxID=239 RepID=UPI003527E39A
MSKTNSIIIGFLFWVPLLFSQTTIKGKVVVKDQSAEGIHVLNLVSEKATITNEKGEFSIEANEDDLLVFSAVHLDYWRKSISANDIKNGFIEVEMTMKEQKLEEVVLTEYTKINAQDLGIINYKPKEYTPAERKLRPAKMTKTDWIGVLTGKIPLDPLLYWVTGRTKILKGELEIEKKELLLKKLNEWYENEFYTNQLNIPEEYINGFKVFTIYDDEFINYLKTNDTVNGSLCISKLANEFLTYLTSDE